jgi:uncharacterized membrane protein
MRPVISAFISDCTNPEDEWTISWVEEFVARWWEMIGIILFGISSALFGIQTSFILVGIMIFIVANVWLARRYGLLKKRLK